jgi:hypothetical protein
MLPRPSRGGQSSPTLRYDPFSLHWGAFTRAIGCERLYFRFVQIHVRGLLTELKIDADAGVCADAGRTCGSAVTEIRGSLGSPSGPQRTPLSTKCGSRGPGKRGSLGPRKCGFRGLRKRGFRDNMGIPTLGSSAYRSKLLGRYTDCSRNTTRTTRKHTPSHGESQVGASGRARHSAPPPQLPPGLVGHERNGRGRSAAVLCAGFEYKIRLDWFSRSEGVRLPRSEEVRLPRSEEVRLPRSKEVRLLAEI